MCEVHSHTQNKQFVSIFGDYFTAFYSTKDDLTANSGRDCNFASRDTCQGAWRPNQP